MITTRYLRGTTDTVLVATQTAGALVFGAVAAPFAWVAPSPVDGLLLAVSGIVAMAAHVCVNRSLKLAPASVVVPYQYTMIVWAIVLGYLVFGDVPEVAMLAGAAIITASGLFIFWREHARGRLDQPMVDPP
jgi:drug/metabolite transporter (DMT)-like permease